LGGALDPERKGKGRGHEGSPRPQYGQNDVVPVERPAIRRLDLDGRRSLEKRPAIDLLEAGIGDVELPLIVLPLKMPIEAKKSPFGERFNVVPGPSHMALVASDPGVADKDFTARVSEVRYAESPGIVPGTPSLHQPPQ